MAEQNATGPDAGESALTIAGFDPCSGAGVTADLLTFARMGVYACSAITALTVQSTRGVRRVQPVDAELLRETLVEVERDLPADGIKIGMLGGASQVQVVAEFVRGVRDRRTITVVIDPVLVSSSGAVLLDADGRKALCDDLLPLVDVVTPNAQEAALLTGQPCRDASEAEMCADALAMRYPSLIPVITGGHLEPPSDLVWERHGATWVAGQRILSTATHGTGCVFSSALLAARLRGETWSAAAAEAKRFVREAIGSAPTRGGGHGPMNLLSRNTDDRSS